MTQITEKHNFKMKGKRIKQTLIFKILFFNIKKKNQRQGNKPQRVCVMTSIAHLYKIWKFISIAMKHNI